MNPESIYYNLYSTHVWNNYWLLNGQLYKVSRDTVENVEELRNDLIDEIENEYLLNLINYHLPNPNINRALQILVNY